jgi:hypothetical protein
MVLKRQSSQDYAGRKIIERQGKDMAKTENGLRRKLRAEER